MILQNIRFEHQCLGELPSCFHNHCVLISLHHSVTTGFGGCVDLIVDGVSLLNKIGLPHAEQPLHHDFIENAEQLAQSFAYFFAPGAAAE